MSKLHQLQKYEARDFKAQYMFEKGLYELLYAAPKTLTNNLVRLWGVDPDMELFKFYQSIPEIEVKGTVNEMFHWDVQGKVNQNCVLKDVEDLAGNSLTAGSLTSSISVQEFFYMYFDKALFSPTLQIKNESGNYQFYIESQEEAAQGTRYKVKAIFLDSSARIPLDELALGTRFSAVSMAQPEHFSYRGINGWMASSYQMATMMSHGRFEYQVSNEMIRQGKGIPLRLPFLVPNMRTGKYETIEAYVNAIDFAAMSFFEVMKAKGSLYSKRNWDVQGRTYGLKDMNGFDIRTAYGLFESIAPGNAQEYTAFDLDFLTDFIFAKQIQKRSRNNRRVKLITGEWGARAFHEAVQRKVNGSIAAINQEGYVMNGNASNTGAINPKKFGFQNTGYVTACNGLEFEVYIADWLDDTSFFPKMHPSALGNVESHTFYVMADGSDVSSNGVYRIRPEGTKMHVGVINGLGSPYAKPGPNGWQDISSKVTGYEVHGHDYFGCVATDPDAILEFRLAVR